jgi:predicted amidophosphoribosyltransferase
MLYQDAPNANIGDRQALQSEARPLPSRCSNCSASLDGPFCAHCGRHLYAEHLLFFLHVHAFVFSVLIYALFRA